MLFYDHGTEDTLHALWPGLYAKYSAPNVEVRGRREARKKGLCVSYGSSSRFVWEGRIQGSSHTELGWKQRDSPQNGLIFFKKEEECFKLKRGGKRTYLQPNQCSTLTFSFWKFRLPPPAEHPPTLSSTKGFTQPRHSASFLKM